MTTMKNLLHPPSQTYDSRALGYIAGLEIDIKDAAHYLGISAGAIALAMAEEHMDEGVPR